MNGLELSGEELLTTTRAVRKRLDFGRAVEPEVIRECVEVAMQAPNGGNAQGWHFVVVFDAEKRAALADLYRQGWELYKKNNHSVFAMAKKQGEGAQRDQLVRVARSADYLADHLERVPVHVIPCMPGRVEQMGGASIALASSYGSIFPAAWSFMLAARNRGLGTCMTTVHLMYEQEAAKILDIPYDSISQCALIPTAYSIGTDFKAAGRKGIDGVLHIDKW